MNCSVCGGPLLFSRVAFHCSCGAYIHAYCLDKHILLAHRPEFEEGTVDLNGDFHPIEEQSPEPAAEEGVAAPEDVESQDAGEEEVGEQEEAEETEAGADRPGFVEVETITEEEKLDAGDVEEEE
jgi:hypothetical protein